MDEFGQRGGRKLSWSGQLPIASVGLDLIVQDEVAILAHLRLVVLPAGVVRATLSKCCPVVVFRELRVSTEGVGSL
jgi:hypothetical protein